MIISLIAAVSVNNVIGKNNDLPWRLPDDMKYFMQTTKNHHVVMGRKNYDSIPKKFKPLADRVNIVVSRNPNLIAEGCQIVDSIDKAIQIAKNNNETELFIIGGADIYNLALPLATRLYLTEIDAVIEGDVYFPTIDKAAWTKTSAVSHDIDIKHQYAFSFNVYEKSF